MTPQEIKKLFEEGSLSMIDLIFLITVISFIVSLFINYLNKF